MPQLVVSIGLSGEPRREELLRKYRELLRLGGLGERRTALWIAPTHGGGEARSRDRLAMAEHGAARPRGDDLWRVRRRAWSATDRSRCAPLSTLQRRRLVRQVIARAAAEGRARSISPRRRFDWAGESGRRDDRPAAAAGHFGQAVRPAAARPGRRGSGNWPGCTPPTSSCSTSRG